MSTGPRRLVVLGDSIVQGGGLAPDESYPALLARMLPADAWQVVNAGQAGGTAIQGALRFGRDVTAQRPDWVLLAFGLNDGALRRNPSDRWRERLWISRQLGVERCWLRLSRRLPGKERRTPAGRPRTRPRRFRWALTEMTRASRRLGAEVCLLSLSPVDPLRIGEAPMAQLPTLSRYHHAGGRPARGLILGPLGHSRAGL